VLGLAATASFMVALDALVVSSALDTIREHLSASVSQLEWTLNAYSLSFAVLLMTASALGDRFGRRRLFVAGLALFSAASAACALSPDAGWLIAARAVQGVGAAMVTPVGMALLTVAIPPARRGWALGLFSGIIGLAVLSGPVVGGAITQGLAWQWIFWLNVPIGAAVIALSLRHIPESHGPATALDFGGVLLVTGAVLALVWGLVRSDAAGWGSAEVVIALIAGAVLTPAFVAWELRVDAPMLPMRLLRSRAFAGANATSFLLFASNFSTVFFMAQFQQISLGQGPLAAGLRLLPWTVPTFLVAPRAGALADRIGERPLIAVGLTLQAVGMAWLAAIASPAESYAGMVAPMIVAGSGIAPAMPLVQRAVLGAVGPQDIGKASGTYNTARWLGAVFGVAILVAVFTAHGGYGSAQAFSDGYAPALGTSAGLAVLGVLTGLLVPRAAVRPAAAAAPPPMAAARLEPSGVNDRPTTST
jgi:EmrB/QacA subfamily drug resistance transporter